MLKEKNNITNADNITNGDNITNADIEKALIDETSNITPYVLNKVKNANLIQLDENIKVEKKQSKLFTIRNVSLIVSILVLFIITLSTTIIYGKEYESLIIDTNPSIELSLNRFNRVISVNYNNEDAYNIFKDVKLKNKKIDSAIILCYDVLYENNYISLENEETNMLVVSGYSEKHQFDETKLDSIIELINNECQKKNIKCSVEKNIVTKEQKEQAKDNGISYGKLKIINLIILETDEYTIDDLKDKTMKELKEIYFSYKNKK